MSLRVTNAQHHVWHTRHHDDEDSSLISKALISETKTEAQSWATRTTRVRFALVANEIHVECIHDFLENNEDPSKVWYSHHEFKTILETIDHDLELLMTGRALEGDEFTMRGLEHRTPAGFEMYQRKRDSALRAVFNEQDRQCKLSKRNAEALADAYRLETKNSQKEALIQGLMDEEDAKR